VYVKNLDAHNQDDPNIRYVDNKEYVQLAETLPVPATARIIIHAAEFRTFKVLD